MEAAAQSSILGKLILQQPLCSCGLKVFRFPINLPFSDPDTHCRLFPGSVFRWKISEDGRLP